MRITCVVVGEGSTEVYIQSVARALVTRYNPNVSLEFKPGEGIHFSNPPGSLAAKVQNAVDLYAPNLILVHRDSDSNNKQQILARFAEVEDACSGIFSASVPVVPVKETEAWMLADKSAILEVVGRDALPTAANEIYPKSPETVQAKERLHEIFRLCRLESEWKPARINTNEDHRQIRTVVRDLGRLESLPSFRVFKEKMQHVLDTLTA